MMIKRYDIYSLRGSTERYENDVGQYVNYEDHLAEVAALREKLVACEKDAELYRALRAMHWTEKRLCVIYAKDLILGAQTYTGDLLDEAIQQSKDSAQGEK